MPKQLIKVNSIAGYKAEERPVSFVLNGKEYKIVKILKTYKSEDITTRNRKIYYEVETEENKKYCLYYNEEIDAWFIFFT